MARVSIRDVAQKAGVSHSTVSRILNQQTSLYRDETVALVRKIAAEAGYRPNLLARSMSSGKTRTIGFLNRPGSGPWVAAVQHGLAEAFVKRGYMMIMLPLMPGEPNLDLVEQLIDRRVDGFVFRPAIETADVDYMEAVSHEGLPVCAIDTMIPAVEGVDFVGTDDEMGGRMVAERLLALGHRRFGVLSFGEMPNQMVRRRSFEATIAKEAGTDCTVVELPPCPDTHGEDGALDLLSRDPRPTAIFACSDRLACGIYGAANRLGLGIPNDVSLVGFADLEFSRFMRPPLTTVRQEPMEMARLAAGMLLDRIEGAVSADAPPERVLLKPEWVERDSAAAR